MLLTWITHPKNVEVLDEVPISIIKKKKISGNICKFLVSNDLFDFKGSGVSICSKILAKQKLNYIVKLKNNIPEVFDRNYELMPVYEKALLNQNISGKINNNIVKNKKF